MAAVYWETWQVIKQFLFATFTAEMAPGGALEGLVAVETVCPPESKQTPVLGFQFRTNSDTPMGQNLWSVTCVFEFQINVLRDYDPTKTDAVKQTALLAENLWSDGNGKGLGAVLNANATLGGLATYFDLDHQIVVGRDVLDENETGAVVAARMIVHAQKSEF